MVDAYRAAYPQKDLGKPLSSSIARTEDIKGHAREGRRVVKIAATSSKGHIAEHARQSEGVRSAFARVLS